MNVGSEGIKGTFMGWKKMLTTLVLNHSFNLVIYHLQVTQLKLHEQKPQLFYEQ